MVANNNAYVLFVDDDPDLLVLYKDALRIEGIKTLVAQSGSEAIALCKKYPGIKAVVSDAHMGEMSGMELLSKLREYYQTMPVFYLITGAFDISEDEIIKAGGTRLILKPFDLEEILEKMKRDIKF